MKLNSSLEYFL